MQKTRCEQDLRDLVECMVAETGEQAKLNADLFKDAPVQWITFSEAEWSRLEGVRRAAHRLGLKDPLTYRGRSYTRRSIKDYIAKVVNRHAGREQ